MIRKFLLSTIAVVGFSGVASAADLPVKAAPYVAQTYDWSGFYLGGFVSEEGDGRIAQPSDQSVPCASPEGLKRLCPE